MQPLTIAFTDSVAAVLCYSVFGLATIWINKLSGILAKASET